MTLMRRPSPLGEFVSIRQAIDRLFEDGVVRPRAWGFAGETAASFPLDIRSAPVMLVVESQPADGAAADGASDAPARAGTVPEA